MKMTIAVLMIAFLAQSISNSLTHMNVLNNVYSRTVGANQHLVAF